MKHLAISLAICFGIGLARMVGKAVLGMDDPGLCTRSSVASDSLRGRDDGYAWAKASNASRIDLCADVASRTGLDSTFVYQGLNTFYDRSRPFNMRQPICDVVGLIGATCKR